MNSKLAEDKILKRLEKLEKELREILKPANDKDINVFSMVGLSKQETKHSFFLANLLSPEGAHGFGNAAVTLLCRRLWRYAHNINGAKQNGDILGAAFASEDELAAAFKGVKVEREVFHKLDDKRNGFCDIMITSPSAKSIMIIENKTFTTSHNDQLARYQQFLEDKYKDYTKRVFVYLTPLGEMPVNKDGDGLYNDAWCIFDYVGIKEIIKELLPQISLRGRSKNKLKIILGDYIDMIDRELIYDSKPVSDKIKNILKNYAVELDMINNYIDITDDIMQFCKQYMLGKGFIDLNPQSASGTQFYFISPEMEKKLSDLGIVNKRAKNLHKFCYRIAKESGYFEKIITIGKGDAATTWENWHKNIADCFGVQLADHSEMRVYRKPLTNDGEIHSEFTDAFKSELENRLDDYVKEIKAFENKILAII